MSVPARHTSHQLVVHADQLIRHIPMHIVGTLYARKGPNGVSEAPRGIVRGIGLDAGRLDVWPAIQKVSRSCAHPKIGCPGQWCIRQGSSSPQMLQC